MGYLNGHGLSQAAEAVPVVQGKVGLLWPVIAGQTACYSNFHIFVKVPFDAPLGRFLELFFKNADAREGLIAGHH